MGAAKVGSVCGSNSATACAASDVTIGSTNDARRDLQVTYSVALYSSTAASSATAAINTAVSMGTFLTALKAKDATFNAVSGVSGTASSSTDSRRRRSTFGGNCQSLCTG